MADQKRYVLEIREEMVQRVDASPSPRQREFDNKEEAEAECRRVGPEIWKVRDRQHQPDQGKAAD